MSSWLEVRRPGPAFGLLAGMQLVLIAGITVIVVALPAVGREFGAGRSGT